MTVWRLGQFDRGKERERESRKSSKVLPPTTSCSQADKSRKEYKDRPLS